MSDLRGGLFIDGNFVRELFDEEKQGGVFRIEKRSPYSRQATWICGACGAEVPVGKVCKGNESTGKIGMEVHDVVDQFEQPCSRDKPVLGPLRCLCHMPLEPYLEVDGGIWGTLACARCHRLLIQSPPAARDLKDRLERQWQVNASQRNQISSLRDILELIKTKIDDVLE